MQYILPFFVAYFACSALKMLVNTPSLSQCTDQNSAEEWRTLEYAGSNAILLFSCCKFSFALFGFICFHWIAHAKYCTQLWDMPESWKNLLLSCCIFSKKCDDDEYDDDDCDSDDYDDDKVFESRNDVEQANDMPAHRGPSESARNENGAVMIMMRMIGMIFVTCTTWKISVQCKKNPELIFVWCKSPDWVFM